MSSNNRIDGNLPSQGEPPSTFNPKKDDTTYISPTGERFPEPAKERSISTHIQATEVKNRNDFKGFMLAKNKLYADIATNSITSQKTRKNKLKISVALYDAFIAPFKGMKTILSVIITGTPP